MKDRSKKGSYDRDIKPLVDLLNATSTYKTTSSCSGRIVLLEIPKIGDKQHAQWHYVVHTLADPKVIFGILQQHRKPLWFLQEPAILHVQCKTLAAARTLLTLAQCAGFKRSGIISLQKNFLELRGTEHIETLLTQDLSEEYVITLVALANEKLQRTKDKITALLQAVVNCGDTLQEDLSGS